MAFVPGDLLKAECPGELRRAPMTAIGYDPGDDTLAIWQTGAMTLQTQPPVPLAGTAAPPATSPAGDALAEALAAALDEVAEAAAEANVVEMVHDARKALKAYRALLRLVPGET
eukprot:gene13620-17385_t